MTFLAKQPEMYTLVALLLLALCHGIHSAEQTEHRDFQYNSVVDPSTGMYNFAYDTGNDNEIAHNLHMQYRDANGVVRGRYGYTDPRGKLRVVEYEAGPNGFVARGDVGPDLFPHDQTPETQVNQVASYTQEEDLQLVPRPVQMAGWNPAEDPMGQPVSAANTDSSTAGDTSRMEPINSGSTGLDGYSTTNNTSTVDLSMYILPLAPFDVRYPRLSISTDEASEGRELESLTRNAEGENDISNMVREEYPVAGPVTVNNIDVDPDEIRTAATEEAGISRPVRRSADGNTATYTSALPYSYRNVNYLRQTHDHDAELAKQATGYRVVYRPSHDHYNERYYRRQTHDHDAERRYVSNRQTHDHDAERRWYLRNRQTHDHDAEKGYVSSRQTHDHSAEKGYVVSRQTHDHDAEKTNRKTHDHDAERISNYRTIYYQNNPDRRRIYYRDSHSMVPHEHYSDIYHNDRSHRHSDIHLYGRPENLVYPATAKPNQLKYIPSDKYHDKYYYWSD